MSTSTTKNGKRRHPNNSQLQEANQAESNDGSTSTARKLEDEGAWEATLPSAASAGRPPIPAALPASNATRDAAEAAVALRAALQRFPNLKEDQIEDLVQATVRRASLAGVIQTLTELVPDIRDRYLVIDRVEGTVQGTAHFMRREAVREDGAESIEEPRTRFWISRFKLYVNKPIPPKHGGKGAKAGILTLKVEAATNGAKAPVTLRLTQKLNSGEPIAEIVFPREEGAADTEEVVYAKTATDLMAKSILGRPISPATFFGLTMKDG